MNPSSLTPYFIVIPALVIGAWAAYANWAIRDSDATVSATITRWSRAAPLLPFALGVLVGHWLW